MKTVFGTHDQNTLDQFDTCLKAGSAHSGVLCADGHYGYAHPIGGVVGYTNHISISGVGYDIGCGNMAVKLDTKLSDISTDTMAILNDISTHVKFGVGKTNPVRVDHSLFESNLWHEAGIAHLKELASTQLGTTGSGNHYVDLLVDTNDHVWIGVHFGSRGLGHKTTTKYLDAIGAKDKMDAEPALIELNTDLADGYLAGMELAGRYAYAGREWVVEKVRSIIGGDVLETVHNHHNFAWFENHFDTDMWVVRKGATPAFPEQKGFIGGSMGDNAVIIKGKINTLARDAMFSTVHGAGRVMSRTDARGKTHRKTGAVIREPMVSKEEWIEWNKCFGVTLLGGGLDESPQAYRRLSDVLNCHSETIDIVDTLKPFGVIMAD